MTNVRRTSERTSARVSERVNGRVRTSGRTRARTCVRLHVHWPRPRARTKIRSTGVDLISVRAKRYNTKSILKRQGRAKICKNKVDSSRPYFRTCARAWRVTVQTHGRTLTRSLARTLTRTYIRLHVRSLARMSFTHTFIPPFMSLVTTRTLDNKNIFTRLEKKLNYSLQNSPLIFMLFLCFLFVGNGWK